MAYTLQETISTEDVARYGLAPYAPEWLASRYVAGASYVCTQVGFGLVIGAGTPPSGMLTAYIYSDVTGGTPDPNINTLLGTSTNTVNQNTVTGSVAEYLFQFSGVSLTMGTPYWFGVTGDTHDSANYVDVVRGAYDSGRYLYYSSDGSTWGLRANGYLWTKTYRTDAPTGQFARPSADVADGNWLNESASNTNLYASIDEVTASDADYIRSGAGPTNDTCTVALGTIGTPVAGTVTMRIRGRFL
jgi:hypothetical protein